MCVVDSIVVCDVFMLDVGMFIVVINKEGVFILCKGSFDCFVDYVGQVEENVMDE